MTTQITVRLDNEEIEKITTTQDLITEIYNELVVDEKNNLKALELLTNAQENLDQIIYQFCNDEYRSINY